MPRSTLVTNAWKTAGSLVRPNGITKSEVPHGTVEGGIPNPLTEDVRNFVDKAFWSQ